MAIRYPSPFKPYRVDDSELHRIATEALDDDDGLILMKYICDFVYNLSYYSFYLTVTGYFLYLFFSILSPTIQYAIFVNYYTPLFIVINAIFFISIGLYSTYQSNKLREKINTIHSIEHDIILIQGCIDNIITSKLESRKIDARKLLQAANPELIKPANTSNNQNSTGILNYIFDTVHDFLNNTPPDLSFLTELAIHIFACFSAFINIIESFALCFGFDPVMGYSFKTCFAFLFGANPLIFYAACAIIALIAFVTYVTKVEQIEPANRFIDQAINQKHRLESQLSTLQELELSEQNTPRELITRSRPEQPASQVPPFVQVPGTVEVDAQRTPIHVQEPITPARGRFNVIAPRGTDERQARSRSCP